MRVADWNALRGLTYANCTIGAQNETIGDFLYFFTFQLILFYHFFFFFFFGGGGGGGGGCEVYHLNIM